MLKKGGNAADAAIAAAFAQGVVDPIYCGIGGGFHGLFRNGASGEVAVVNAGGRAPAGAKPDMWNVTGRWGAIWTVEGALNRFGYQASMIPGFVAGAWSAFTRFGSGAVSWGEVIAPAIALAANGFRVYPYLYRLWMPATDRMRNFLESDDGPTVLSQTAECARIYLKDDGSVYRVGETLVQSDYARTLIRIAEIGPEDFYRGETAELIAADFAANGGLLTKADLAGYQADVVQPLRTRFRGMEVFTEPPPTVGPVTAQILNVIDGVDLAALGWNSPAYLAWLAKAMHVGFRDRMNLLGDPDFVEVPLDQLLSDEYAARIRDQIDNGETGDKLVSTSPLPVAETTHTSAMDELGNAAAITHSLGMSSGVVTPGLGFQHNCHMIMFDPAPGHRNSIAPGKRPITGGGPVLFKREGQPWLLIGSPAGARKVTALTQATLNMLDFDMDPQTAVSVDRIHVEDEPGVVIVEPHFDPDTLMGLAEMGFDIRFEWYTARLGAVERTASGELRGGSDPRGGRGLEVVQGGPR
ncbi:MAG: gamma-glutamyltransferase family protein [Actinobacteria bacterium]|nr:gamma-glutamyltransferase family protein [Actinomycetota bacterium]